MLMSGRRESLFRNRAVSSARKSAEFPFAPKAILKNRKNRLDFKEETKAGIADSAARPES